MSVFFLYELDEHVLFEILSTTVASIWANYNDLTVLPHWNHGFYMGNHPKMAQHFRLVSYYNLP